MSVHVHECARTWVSQGAPVFILARRRGQGGLVGGLCLCWGLRLLSAAGCHCVPRPQWLKLRAHSSPSPRARSSCTAHFLSSFVLPPFLGEVKWSSCRRFRGDNGRNEGSDERWLTGCYHSATAQGSNTFRSVRLYSVLFGSGSYQCFLFVLNRWHCILFYFVLFGYV